MFIINAQKIKGSTSKSMRAAIEEKLAFLDGNGDVKVTVQKEGELLKVSTAFVDKYNHHYYISTKRPDFYEAIDRLKDKCNREIREYNKQYKANKVVDKSLYASPETIIAKEKVLVVDEMSMEDAVREMENLGHDWFVYRDTDDKGFAIIYKRYRDGYGVMRIK